MDDRNLVAVAEQAAATSRVATGPIAGCTILADDGRVFLGCLIEYADPELNQDPIANGLAAGLVQGMRKVQRIGYYSPTGGSLPSVPVVTLRRLQELGTPDLEVLFSPGSGRVVQRSLGEMLAEVGAS